MFVSAGSVMADTRQLVPRFFGRLLDGCGVDFVKEPVPNGGTIFPPCGKYAREIYQRQFCVRVFGVACGSPHPASGHLLR